MNEDREIQNTLNNNLKDSQLAYAFKIFSCIDMSLIALSTFVCSPAFIAGLVITSVVAAYYIHKNGNALAQKLFPSNTPNKLLNFFKPKTIEVKEDGAERDLYGKYSFNLT